MKPLELTNKQKDKLLEMTKKLFSEYNNIQFSFYSDEYFSDKWSDTPSFGDILSFSREDIKTGRNVLINIHWFEFCMTWLPKALITHKVNKYQPGINIDINFINIDGSMQDDYNELVANVLYEQFKMKHPVDYLYEEFKKIK